MNEEARRAALADLAESKARLEYWAGIEGGAYRALARRHARGELVPEVEARLAAQGRGPDGQALEASTKRRSRKGARNAP